MNAVVMIGETTMQPNAVGMEVIVKSATVFLIGASMRLGALVTAIV